MVTKKKTNTKRATKKSTSSKNVQNGLTKQQIINAAKKELNTVKAKLKEAEKKTDALIKKNPEKAALISAAVAAAITAGVTVAVEHAKKKRK